MTAKERKEHAHLQRLWATQRATRKQIMRCMALDSKASNANKEDDDGNCTYVP